MSGNGKKGTRKERGKGSSNRGGTKEAGHSGGGKIGTGKGSGSREEKWKYV